MKRQLLLACLTTCALGACSPAANTSVPAGAPVRAIGADWDAQGCIGSAGYTWSSVRRSCIRIFESGLAFEPETAQRSAQAPVLQAFVVLAPAEGPVVTEAQAFIPGRSRPIELTLVNKPGRHGGSTLLVNEAQGVEIVFDQGSFFLIANGQRFHRPAAANDRLNLLR